MSAFALVILADGQVTRRNFSARQDAIAAFWLERDKQPGRFTCIGDVLTVVDQFTGEWIAVARSCPLADRDIDDAARRVMALRSSANLETAVTS